MAASILFAIRVALGIILITAALQKLRSPRQFIAGVAGYRILPRQIVPPVALCVLTVEAVTGFLLLLNIASVLAVLTAVCLFALFSSALMISLVRRNDAPCFCFGAEQAEPISPSSVVRASWLLVLAGLALAISRRAGGASPATVEAAPALTFAAGIIVVTRFIGVFSYAVDAFRTHPVVSATRTPRISFRSAPPDFSLKRAVEARRKLINGGSGD